MQPRVLLVCSEAVPLIKTGGLADVITALAGALRDKGVDASILMPGYPAALDGVQGLRPVSGELLLPGGKASLVQGLMPDSNIPVILLDSARFRSRTGNPYVGSDGVELPDNAESFADLAHAAVAICAGRTEVPVPHIVHANDWHAGLIPGLMKAAGLDKIGTVLTIHNLAFQGIFPMALRESLGIPIEMAGTDGMEYWEKLSFMKAGIVYADRISTVSKTYAKEILTPRFGSGMNGALNKRAAAIRAIPNGIDTRVWNPANDPLTARDFSRQDMRGKGACKRDLQRLFGLLPIDPFAPVLAIGSRISHQKMADVALQALPQILDRQKRLQVVVLGCGDHAYEEGFRELARGYPQRVGIHIGYDERHAHALHAGADILLHGTRFEPFGLTPLYAMRYGTIPIGSRVGGLIDTIIDAGDPDKPTPGANGFLFDGETPEDMVAAVDRAFGVYVRAEAWQAMQRNAMKIDFGWSGPAAGYLAMYAEIAPREVREFFVSPESKTTQANAVSRAA
ncbi:MAG: glycogen synthase [Herbaspirillum sp.]|nr:glycogen synthase [Herbaspirillum sp.]